MRMQMVRQGPAAGGTHGDRTHAAGIEDDGRLGIQMGGEAGLDTAHKESDLATMADRRPGDVRSGRRDSPPP